MKLEKDKAAKKAFEIQTSIKAHEEQVQKQIDANMKKQVMGGKMDSNIQQKGMNTPWPEDARPNPYLSE